MNGPDHYREAERLLALAADPPAVVTADHITDADEVRRFKEEWARHSDLEVLVVGNTGYVDTKPVLLAAQVHATLAVAAATAHDAISVWSDNRSKDDAVAWMDATA